MLCTKQNTIYQWICKILIWNILLILLVLRVGEYVTLLQKFAQRHF